MEKYNVYKNDTLTLDIDMWAYEYLLKHPPHIFYGGNKYKVLPKKYMQKTGHGTTKIILTYKIRPKFMKDDIFYRIANCEFKFLNEL